MRNHSKRMENKAKKEKECEKNKFTAEPKSTTNKMNGFFVWLDLFILRYVKCEHGIFLDCSFSLSFFFDFINFSIIVPVHHYNVFNSSSINWQPTIITNQIECDHDHTNPIYD